MLTFIMLEQKKVILVIRDGWGYRKEKKNNAIAKTPTPNTDFLMKNYPNTLLSASGESVGLPKGYQGNSEVGHMTIGSGRILFQSLERINSSIADKSFFKNPAFIEAINNAKKNNTYLHLIGLIQEEGVHSHLNHLFALIDLCKKEKFCKVKIHVITDGRDAPVKKSIDYITKLEKKIKKTGIGEIVSVQGRFFAMDRDKRWERTQKAYDCIVLGKAENDFVDTISIIKKSHRENKTDEFIIPVKKRNYSGIKENDSVIFFNFRTDRTRQLTRAIVEENFEGWQRKPLNICFVAMTQFYQPMNALIAYPEQSLTNLLGEIVANANLKQLRISETEKYAHVTFFFNGQKEEPNKNEERILIASPKVLTYDLKPEMSAYEVTEKLCGEIDSKKFDFIVTNLVNGDMVGHTGNVEAINKAVKTVDDCVGKIYETGLKNGYTLLIFADHGNVEDQSKNWVTSHTTNKVPFILVSEDKKLKKVKLKKGKGLQDIAPTALKILGLAKSKEMTGESIF